MVYLAPMKRPILVRLRLELSLKHQVTSCSGGRIRTGDLPIMSRMLSPTELRRLDYRALCGNRTHHLFLTMEVLYRMS